MVKLNPKQQKDDVYGSMNINALKPLLKERGLAVSGNKDVLVKRLRDHDSTKENCGAMSSPASTKASDKTRKASVSTKASDAGRKVSSQQNSEKAASNPKKQQRGAKPKQWRYSEEKKELSKKLLDPTNPIHGMSISEVYESDPNYKQWELKKFQKYYKDLGETIKKRKQRADLDNVAVAEHKHSFPRGAMNNRGYPYWDTHPAKELLEVDVYKKVHESMTREALRLSRKEYTEFPKEVFTKRVNREIYKQSSATYWGLKRSKKGLQRYLKSLEERACKL